MSLSLHFLPPSTMVAENLSWAHADPKITHMRSAWCHDEVLVIYWICSIKIAYNVFPRLGVVVRRSPKTNDNFFKIRLNLYYFERLLIPRASWIWRRGASTSATSATVAKGAEGTVAMLVGQFTHVSFGLKLNKTKQLNRGNSDRKRWVPMSFWERF